jgi:hypothetical protein
MLKAERFYDRASYGSFCRPGERRKWIISAAVNRAIPPSERTAGGDLRGARRASIDIVGQYGYNFADPFIGTKREFGWILVAR